MDTLSKYLLTNTWILHVLGWLLWISIEMGYVIKLRVPLDPWYTYVVFYAVNIALFYIYRQLLDFTFSTPNRWYIGLLLFSILMTVYLAVKLGLTKTLTNENWLHLQIIIYSSLYRASNFLVAGTVSWFAGRIATVRLDLQLANQERLLAESNYRVKLQQTEVAYLNQRLNPHLLFNTLNSIYSKVIKHSKPAAEDVLLLSDIMQYSSVPPDEDGKVLLNDELAQIVNLIALNEHRFEDNLYLEVRLDQANISDRIPPLLLLSLTENMFKHGDLLDRKHPASLSIQISRGKLSFRSSNLKRQNQLQLKCSRLGIEQARIRLAYYYPNRHRLTVNNEEQYFTIELEVEL